MLSDDGPTLHQLRCFVAVAEAGQFTSAAEHLGIAQPSLSSQVGRLEQILDVELFHRAHRPVTLTDAGEALLPIARRALGSVDDVVRAVAEVEDLRRGHVTVGATPSLGATLLPRVLARFHEHHPDITLTVFERHSDDLAEQLESGQLDLALAILPMRRGALEHTVLAIEELVVMVPADHPLAGEHEVRLEQLRHGPLIMFRAGYNPETVVRPLAAPRLERAIGLVRPTSRPPSRSAAALIEDIIAFLVSGEWEHEGAVGFRLAPGIGS